MCGDELLSNYCAKFNQCMSPSNSIVTLHVLLTFFDGLFLRVAQGTRWSFLYS